MSCSYYRKTSSLFLRWKSMFRFVESYEWYPTGKKYSSRCWTGIYRKLRLLWKQINWFQRIQKEYLSENRKNVYECSYDEPTYCRSCRCRKHWRVYWFNRKYARYDKLRQFQFMSYRKLGEYIQYSFIRRKQRSLSAYYDSTIYSWKWQKAVRKVLPKLSASSCSTNNRREHKLLYSSALRSKVSWLLYYHKQRFPDFESAVSYAFNVYRKCDR